MTAHQFRSRPTGRLRDNFFLALATGQVTPTRWAQAVAYQSNELVRSNLTRDGKVENIKRWLSQCILVRDRRYLHIRNYASAHARNHCGLDAARSAMLAQDTIAVSTRQDRQCLNSRSCASVQTGNFACSTLQDLQCFRNRSCASNCAPEKTQRALLLHAQARTN